MKYFIFGMDADHPAQCARKLRECGMEAVVSGNFTPECVEALQAEGLDLYLCFGAYGVPKESAALAQDAFGQLRRWFGSGCPNDPANAKKHMDEVLAKAAVLPQVKGIWVDGARFASFASEEGFESFFTCFCPRCMQAMADMDLDAEAVREAVGHLMQTRQPRLGDEALLQGWLTFRERCVQQYMDEFAQRVHALRSSLKAGAFIFAPSLGRFVGQTAAACRSLDVVSHMLYRDYRHTHGPACLGHEWAAMLRGFGSNAKAFRDASAPASPFFVEKTPDALLAHGFEPDWAGREVAQARREWPDKQLWPIIQSDDPLIDQTACHAFQNGADTVGLFSWWAGDVPHLE